MNINIEYWIEEIKRWGYKVGLEFRTSFGNLFYIESSGNFQEGYPHHRLRTTFFLDDHWSQIFCDHLAQISQSFQGLPKKLEEMKIVPDPFETPHGVCFPWGDKFRFLSKGRFEFFGTLQLLDSNVWKWKDVYFTSSVSGVFSFELPWEEMREFLLVRSHPKLNASLYRSCIFSIERSPKKLHSSVSEFLELEKKRLNNLSMEK